MVLRAGIILPFQFGDVKKLLMVGSPEEDRDLKLFDFTNVVRAAFNIYNFEFRNKKIDFLIPEELLIHYLEQCKDLTNFVIQVDQASINASAIFTSDVGNNALLIEPSCSQHRSGLFISKHANTDPNLVIRSSFTAASTSLSRNSGDLGSPLDVTSHSDHSMSNNQEPVNKIRRSQFYVDRTPESLTQSIDPNDIMPKSEQDEAELHASKVRQHRQLQQQQQQQQIQLPHQTSHFFPNYSHTILSPATSVGHQQPQAPPHTQSQTQSQPQHPIHLQHATNRFRIDGRQTQSHCVTCHCFTRYEMFGPNSMLNLHVMPEKISSNCNSSRKIYMNSFDRSTEMKIRNGSDGNLSHHSNRSLKVRKLSNSSRTVADDECDPPTPKLRVSNNLLDRESSIPSNSNKATSTTSSDTTSPDDKSTSNNTLNDEDDNESNDSAVEQEHEDITPPTYNHAANEYYAQKQIQLAQQQLQLSQQQQQIYEEPQQHFEHQYPQAQYSAVYLPAEENGNSRQRKERMSKRQKELYVEFLEQNPVVNKHRRNDPLLDIFWIRLANILNSCPNGAAKSVAEWKQAFDNWRYRVFLYARHNSQLNEDDAMNSKAFKPLTRSDKRAYNLWIRNPDTAPANTEKLPNDLAWTSKDI